MSKRPKQKTKAQLISQVATFNLKHSIGEVVQARHSLSQPYFDVTVKHPAGILGGHTAVGWFKELPSCHSLDFVRDKPDTTCTGDERSVATKMPKEQKLGQ